MNKLLITEFEKIDRREMLDCRMKTLKEFARFYGTDLPTSYVYLLTESFSFWLGKINFPSLSVTNIPYAVVSDNQVEQTFFANLDLEVMQEAIPADASGMAHLKSLVDAGLPVICKMDGRIFLPRKELKADSSVSQIHYLSYVLLVGYDNQLDRVRIVLTHFNSIEAPISFPISEFQAARESVCFPYSPGCMCLYRTKRSKVALPDAKIETLLLYSIKRTVANMLYGQARVLNIPDFDCHQLNSGLAAMEDFRNCLLTYQVELSADKKNEILRKKIEFSLLFLRSSLMNGTVTGFRYEFGQALVRFGEEFGYWKFEEAGKKFLTSAKLWQEWLSLVGRIPHDMNHLSHYLDRIEMVFNKIIHLEKKAFLWIEKI